MRKRSLGWGLVLAFAIGLASFAPARAETMRIGGTGTALGTMKLLGEAFMTGNPGTAIKVLPSLGSGGGIRAVSAGAIELAVSARPLKDPERANGLQAMAYGKSAVVFAVRSRTHRQDLTGKDLVAIFKGSRMTWPDGTPMRSAEEPVTTTHDIPTGQETILLVEDDPALRQLAISMLEGLGYTVLAAEDGPAAMTLLRRALSVDLLFTDVVLPNGMHEVKLAEKARRRYPHLKALLTTGYTKASIMERLDLEPGIQVLHKPYRRQDLVEKVRAALDAAEDLVAAAAGR